MRRLIRFICRALDRSLSLCIPARSSTVWVSASSRSSRFIFLYFQYREQRSAAPTDMARMNGFVTACNKYVASIEHSLLSVKDQGEAAEAFRTSAGRKTDGIADGVPRGTDVGESNHADTAAPARAHGAASLSVSSPESTIMDILETRFAWYAIPTTYSTKATSSKIRANGDTP